ncbi:hypothetical protein CBI30_05295 [Polynucleobacter aenigmaticus]|uniref:Peptidoglycan hydrolase FlgJ n=1 Tax=Polynucleobacter aenigmaticus TaxID=1743164 RepID=A0A254Q061_9BURK|nr:flagellar assembly peptidoglycan hydrolase FlgJ [Polynucleobacter aenigmaticus]OWS71868.1 hypothetical protein CBI30_05295 [Polynucleobacter aenigmaticus]
MSSILNTSGLADLSGQLAMDANGLGALKRSAKENSPQAIKEVAKQFEAIFMNMMLKSMRDASPQDGLFDSEQSKTFTSMLDQQLSQKLASKGIGLANVLVRQLTKSDISPEKALGTDLTKQLNNHFNHHSPIVGGGALPTPVPSLQHDGYSTVHQLVGMDKTGLNRANGVAGVIENTGPVENGLVDELKKVVSKAVAKDQVSLRSISDEFTSKMASYAKIASLATGLPMNFMMGQAALETGWGKKEIKGLDGAVSNNLFAIKASANWTGKVVSTITSEYIHGVKQQRIERFRAYDSYADSFKDFANMIKNSPRYQQVMNNLHSATDYAQALQSAGYATDPQYALKLAGTIKQIRP